MGRYGGKAFGTAIREFESSRPRLKSLLERLAKT
jgi:hypothetical protein